MNPLTYFRNGFTDRRSSPTLPPSQGIRDALQDCLALGQRRGLFFDPFGRNVSEFIAWNFWIFFEGQSDRAFLDEIFAEPEMFSGRFVDVPVVPVLMALTAMMIWVGVV